MQTIVELTLTSQGPHLREITRQLRTGNVHQPKFPHTRRIDDLAGPYGAAIILSGAIVGAIYWALSASR